MYSFFVPYAKILLILCTDLKVISILVKKKKGKRLGNTTVAQTDIPLAVDRVYLVGFRIITNIINKITIEKK